jgi:hypothetical protein
LTKKEKAIPTTLQDKNCSNGTILKAVLSKTIKIYQNMLIDNNKTYCMFFLGIAQLFSAGRSSFAVWTDTIQVLHQVQSLKRRHTHPLFCQTSCRLSASSPSTAFASWKSSSWTALGGHNCPHCNHAACVYF